MRNSELIQQVVELFCISNSKREIIDNVSKLINVIPLELRENALAIVTGILPTTLRPISEVDVVDEKGQPITVSSILYANVLSDHMTFTTHEKFEVSCTISDWNKGYVTVKPYNKL